MQGQCCHCAGPHTRLIEREVNAVVARAVIDRVIRDREANGIRRDIARETVLLLNAAAIRRDDENVVFHLDAVRARANDGNRNLADGLGDGERIGEERDGVGGTKIQT